MQLTKEQLIDAHEQGSIINTRNGNIKIVAILGDVYGVNHCDTNSKLVKLWMFENFERNQATIEQHKPKIDLSILKEGEIYFAKSTMYNYLFKLRYSTQSEIIWDSNVLLRDNEINNLSAGIKLSYVSELRLPTESELELFYSRFPELKPKKYIQGFEVKDGYNEIVSCSNDNVNFRIDILKIVYSDNCQFPFTCVNGSYRYVRYPHKEEINEIKFSN